MPSAFVYEYPSLRLHRILRKGTEKAYSACAFNGRGDKLATVGSYPDYMLTVWNWKQEKIVLRTKAFAQEVFNVAFSPRSDGVLVTSGTVHIRFWKMARTFTGLKLQGEMGKFGQVEISDISGYVELPDGKVISTTEQGRLLLWEGNLIKCQIQRAGGKPCHDGTIELVELDEENGALITGGGDGYMRTWPLQAFLDAEVTDEKPIVEVEASSEVSLSGIEAGRAQATVTTMLRGDGHTLVQDGAGGLYKLDTPPPDAEPGAAPTARPLLSFHSGPILGADTCAAAAAVAVAVAVAPARPSPSPPSPEIPFHMPVCPQARPHPGKPCRPPPKTPLALVLPASGVAFSTSASSTRIPWQPASPRSRPTSASARCCPRVSAA